MFNIFKKNINKQNKTDINNQELLFFSKDLKKIIKDLDKENIIIINIDKFMEFNIEFGFENGNLLLKEIKERINNFFYKDNEEEKKFFQISPDTFLIKVKEYETDISNIKKLIEYIEYPYNIDKKKIHIKIRCSVSSSKYEDIKNVIYGIKFAKKQKKNIVYSSEIIKEKKLIKEKFKIFSLLKESLEEDNIVAYYQPVIDKNNNIKNYEVLIRIQKNGKLISPGHFLNIAKEFRLYLQLSENILKKSIDLYKTKNIPFSINLNMEDLESNNFRKKLIKVIKENFNKNDRNNFYIEISTSRKLTKEGEVFLFLKELKKTNINIILDDFGEGFNNIETLYNLKDVIWGIKYSGQLIKDIDKDELKQKILLHINAALKAMNIVTIAKFVENKEIKDFLIDANVDYFQGFFCSTPQDFS